LFPVIHHNDSIIIQYLPDLHQKALLSTRDHLSDTVMITVSPVLPSFSSVIVYCFPVSCAFVITIGVISLEAFSRIYARSNSISGWPIDTLSPVLTEVVKPFPSSETVSSPMCTSTSVPSLAHSPIACFVSGIWTTSPSTGE